MTNLKKVLFKETETFNAIETFNATKNSESIKDNVGCIINPKGYIEFDDVNAKGETHHILVLVDNNGKAYSTNSETFRREFSAIEDIVSDFGLTDFSISVKEVTTKNNRKCYMPILVES